MTDFTHVIDTRLRAILSAADETLRWEDIAESLEKTHAALGRDLLRQDVPAHAIEARQMAVTGAEAAFQLRQPDRAMAEIRSFWIS